MTLTLEEAIKHCEEIAENNEKIAGTFEYSLKTKSDCKKCASEHRQLAEWLKELKAYRDDCDCDYETLKIKLENAEDIIRGLQSDLRDAREEMRWR